MPKADVEKTSYGAFERFMYLFLFPILFTAILTVILLSIFDYDVMNAVLKTANKIPVVEKMIPDPKNDQASSGADDIHGNTPSAEETTVALQLQLEQMESTLVEAEQKVEQQQQLIAGLEEQVELLSSQQAAEQLSEQQYLEAIQRLSSTYANMMPTRAAAIIQNLTMSEMVLLLHEMSSKKQVQILEKMNPALAAEASILLKDVQQVEDLQIAALQERLQVYRDREPTEAESLSDLELAITFSSMNGVEAAEILMEMVAFNEAKVISILRLMDVEVRSAIVAEISNVSASEAAQLIAKLGE